MKDKERDYLDDLFREKLYNFEAEPDAADWQAKAEQAQKDADARVVAVQFDAMDTARMISFRVKLEAL